MQQSDSTMSRTIEPRSRPFSSYPGSWVVFKDSPTPEPGCQSTQRCCSSWFQSILSNRHLSKYDQYLYAPAINITQLGCPRAVEVSTHSFHPKQHLTVNDIIIHQNTIQLRLKCRNIDQFWRGATTIIGPSKQDICLVQISKQFYTSGNMHTNQIQYTSRLHWAHLQRSTACSS